MAIIAAGNSGDCYLYVNLLEWSRPSRLVSTCVHIAVDLLTSLEISSRML
jgi:hypothetical protein